MHSGDKSKCTVEKSHNAQWRTVKMHSGKQSKCTVDKSQNARWRKVKMHGGEKQVGKEEDSGN